MTHRTRLSLGLIAAAALMTTGCCTSAPKHNPGAPFEIGGMPLHSSTVQSRAITGENQKGEVGQGGQSHDGRKGLPCLWNLKKDQVYTFAEIEGPGVIRHIWITAQNSGPHKMRNLILRFYWDDQETPSVEAPLTDFFGTSHGKNVEHQSYFTQTPEGKAFNCNFPMPFSKKAKLQVCNETGEDAGMWFYQVDYTVGDDVTAETPTFHAQFRRVANTELAKDYVIIDGIEGKGRFLGCNIGLVDRFANIGGAWWGEGEVKMYIDDDDKYPTICGTGSEDYVGSGWGLGLFDTLYFGSTMKGHHVSCYRWHVMDPIYFNDKIKVTIQQLGNDGQYEPKKAEGKWKELVETGQYRKDRSGGCFERVDDVCSTAYWYQTLPTKPFPPFPNKELRSLDLPK